MHNSLASAFFSWFAVSLSFNSLTLVMRDSRDANQANKQSFYY